LWKNPKTKTKGASMKRDPSWAHAAKIPVQGIGLAIPNGDG
jgi:hypothetical protein